MTDLTELIKRATDEKKMYLMANEIDNLKKEIKKLKKEIKHLKKEGDK